MELQIFIGCVLAMVVQGVLTKRRIARILNLADRAYGDGKEDGERAAFYQFKEMHQDLKCKVESNRDPHIKRFHIACEICRHDKPIQED